jgi:glycosyltransferase involved in cell wall biosynthesis
MGIPTIATRCVGSVDYFRDGETGFLVPSGDVAEMRRLIEKLWRDEALRKKIGSAGFQYGNDLLSDEAAGKAFGDLLSELVLYR